MSLKKYLPSFFLILAILLSGCTSKKEEAEVPTKKEIFEPNVQKRTEKYRDSTGGILGNFGKKNSGTFDFANSNVLWRASLKSLENIPLQSASYAGGILVTDWYGNNNESIKIEINFKSDKLESSSIIVKSFIKKCQTTSSCATTSGADTFNTEIKTKILSQARQIALEDNKNKK